MPSNVSYMNMSAIGESVEITPDDGVIQWVIPPLPRRTYAVPAGAGFDSEYRETDSPSPEPDFTPLECSFCGHEHTRSSNVWTEQIWEPHVGVVERTICADCFYDGPRMRCNRCSASLRDSDWDRPSPFLTWHDAQSGRSLAFCPDCVPKVLVACTACGSPIPEQLTSRLPRSVSLSGVSERGLCPKCYGDRVAFKAYNYRPSEWVLSLAEDERIAHAMCLGVELEADAIEPSELDEDSWNPVSAARGITKIDPEHLFVKHDGSLDEGLEVVFHPATLTVHRALTPWHAVFEKLARWDLSTDVSTCGLHVHVSRAPLLKTQTSLLKLSCFVYMHPNEMTALGRRDLNRCQRYAKWKRLKGTPVDTSQRFNPLNDEDELRWRHAVSAWDRYEALNFSNEDTVEFRFMKGPDTVDTLLSYLEMVDAIVRFTHQSSISHILRPASAWREFCDYLCANYRTYKRLVMRMRELDLWKPTKEKRK